MALPKSKSRAISINGETFRYIVSVSRKGTGTFNFNITVQNEESNGRKLILKGLVTRDFWLDFSDIVKENVGFDKELYPTITPKHVAHFIKQGILEGWKFHTAGDNFILNISNSDLTSSRKNADGFAAA